jgi:hypothetical protein
MDKNVDRWVDRHECIQRRNAAGIAKRATYTILRNTRGDPNISGI